MTRSRHGMVVAVANAKAPSTGMHPRSGKPRVPEAALSDGRPELKEPSSALESWTSSWPRSARRIEFVASGFR